MRIYQLSKFYSPYSGGLESVVKDIATGLSADIVVFACTADRLPRRSILDGVEVIRSREWFNFASTSISFGYVRDVLSVEKGALLHVHLPNPMANVALFAAYILRRDLSNVVIHWHSDIVKQKALFRLYRPLLNWLLDTARTVIVTSQNYLDSSEQLSDYRGKCVIVPIGIDSILNRVDEHKVESIRNSHVDKKIVFSLGRHVYYKGFETLIEAVPLVDNTVFLIGGSGPDTEKYKRRVRELGVEEKVKFIGRVSDDELPSYYRAADAFCFPSIEKSEAFGVVQLEAMSVGTPIISTKIKGSGVPWVNAHMQSGLLCEPKDSDALARELNRLLSDDDLLKRLGQGAKKRYETLFTREKMVRMIEDEYQKIMDGTG